MMTRADYLVLLPLIITGYGGAILMTIVAFWRSHAVSFALSMVALVSALASVFVAIHYSPRVVTPLLRIDNFSLFFTGLVLAGAILVALMGHDYLPSHERRNEAFYVLVLFAVLGMIAIICSAHFASFFLGLETLSVSLYGLIGYSRGHKPSLEASMKYLVLAATSSAFLLFGIALIYADLGTMGLHTLSALITAGKLTMVSYFGLALVLVGFGFKLAIVPFHMWSPDVYQGAPSPVTALIATGSKGAVFALLLKLFVSAGLGSNKTAFLVISILAIATMFGGNLLALLQTNVKRMLAYSSIAHIGYLLIPLLAGGVAGASSIAFYFVSYFATTIAAFGVIAAISTLRPMGDVEDFSEYRGLSLRHPILAAIMSLALLSLTGIPLTSGFIAKFYIFTAAARSGLWSLLIIGAINSGLSAFYYMRLLVMMYSRPQTAPEPLPSTKPATAIALAISSVVILIFGIYPTPLIRLAQAAVMKLGF